MGTAWRHVFCVTDIEGVAGVCSWEQTRQPGPRLEEARVLATAEVNSVLAAWLDPDGAVDGRVPRITVWDGHGYGGLQPDRLDPRVAFFAHDDPRGFPGLLRLLVEGDDPVDAIAFIGQHAMEGSGGTLAHTFSSRRIRSYRLNGEPIGEFGLRALLAWAMARVPVIFISGDDIACAEARACVPGVVTAEVKQSLGLNAADSLPADRSLAVLAERARLALALRPEDPRLQPACMPRAPFELRKDYKLKFGVLPRPARRVRGTDLVAVLEGE